MGYLRLTRLVLQRVLHVLQVLLHTRFARSFLFLSLHPWSQWRCAKDPWDSGENSAYSSLDEAVTREVSEIIKIESQKDL